MSTDSQRSTTNRPVLATAFSAWVEFVSSRGPNVIGRHGDCSASAGRTPTCTGPRIRVHKQCAWKPGEELVDPLEPCDSWRSSEPKNPRARLRRGSCGTIRGEAGGKQGSLGGQRATTRSNAPGWPAADRASPHAARRGPRHRGVGRVGDETPPASLRVPSGVRPSQRDCDAAARSNHRVRLRKRSAGFASRGPPRRPLLTLWPSHGRH